MGVRLAGTGIHPFGRFEGKTPTDIGVHAVRAALAGRAHGLPATTLLAFLGPAEAASRLELALRA